MLSLFLTLLGGELGEGEVVGAPTGARVPFVRVPSCQGEFARVESYQGKTNARVESYQGGKLSGAIYPGAKILAPKGLGRHGRLSIG